MGKDINGAVVCNPINPLDAKKSGALMFAIERAALGIDYGQYRAQDAKMGSIKEINTVQRAGKKTSSDFTLKGNNEIGFMPTATVLNNEFPKGIARANEHNETKKNNQEIFKAMGLKLDSVDAAMVGTGAVPVIGSKEWVPIRKGFIAGGGSINQEAQFRSTMVAGMHDKQEGMEDVVGMTIGYFGRLDPKNRVVPAAMYHTFLQCLEVTDKLSFHITNKDLDLIYRLDEWYHLEVDGVIEGNDAGKVGYSVSKFVRHAIDPKKISGATVLNSNNSGKLQSGQSFGKTMMSAAKAGYYVTLQVQVTSTMYKELILGGLEQMTIVDNGKEATIVNSAFPSKAEKKADGFDFEEYYIGRTFIPLTKESLMKIKLFSRANLLIECKCSVVKVLNVREKKWYESVWFKVVMFVVAVVINYFFPGGGTFLQALIQTAIQMLVVYAISYLIQALIDAGIITNGWVAAVLQAVLTVVAIYYGTPGAVNMDFTLMTTAMRMVEATGKAYAYELQIQKKEHREIMAELKKEKDKLDELDDEYEKLHTSSNLGRLALAAKRLLEEVDIPIFESRDEFLQRTMNAKPVTETITLNGLRTRLILP